MANYIHIGKDCLMLLAADFGKFFAPYLSDRLAFRQFSSKNLTLDTPAYTTKHKYAGSSE